MDQKEPDKTKITKRKRKKKRSIGKKILISFLILLFVFFAAATGIMLGVVKSAPTIDVDILNNLKQTSMMYDKDEKPIERVAAGGKDDQNRTIVTLNEIPKDLQHAFISIEDERFYKHGGIDVKRIFGAIFHNFKTMSKSQGASTITQQLIKNYALTPEKKITRKLQEMYLSMQLEKKLSKDQILEAYLNTIYLGGNTYGVENATKLYFGDTQLKDLSLAQCALIAGITQNPSKYYPYSKRNESDPSAYIQRQHTVLAKMLENGYINQEQYEKAKAEKLEFVNKKPVYSGKYQWFVEPALEQVAKDLAAKENIDEKEARNRVATGGYNIYLTIDTNLQDAAQKVVDNKSYYSGLYVPSKYRNYSPNEKTEKKIQPQAAAAIFDYHTGEMRAIIGGRGDHEVGSLNRATEVPRQPGSTIKPLSVYAPALDKGRVTPYTPIKTTPLAKSETENNWDPKNASSNFGDTVSVREGLIKSINTVAARIGKRIGKDTSIDYLKNKFHISTLTSADNVLPALVLGGMNQGTLATEMAAAYGVFGNKGMYESPIMYTKVVDRNGNMVLENKSVESKAISLSAAYSVLDMMQSIAINNKGISFSSMPSAGKTGTTNDSKTVWYTGLTPYYSGAVWIGHDKPSIEVSGLKNTYPARIWSAIMTEAHKGLEYKDFGRPSGYQSVELCPESGKRFSEDCKKAGLSPTKSYFAPGKAPTAYCDIHSGGKTNEQVTNPDNQTPSTSKPDTTTPSNGGGSTKPDGGTKPKPDGGTKPKPDGGTKPKPDDGTKPKPDDGTKPKPDGDGGNGETDGNGGNGGNGESTSPTAMRNILNSIFSLIYFK